MDDQTPADQHEPGAEDLAEITAAEVLADEATSDDAIEAAVLETELVDAAEAEEAEVAATEALAVEVAAQDEAEAVAEAEAAEAVAEGEAEAEHEAAPEAVVAAVAATPVAPSPAALGRGRHPEARPRPAGPSPSERFGRVDDDGNVFVLLPDGNEHLVGQWAAGDKDAGLRMFAVRFDDLLVDVDLAGTRMAEGRMSPDEAQRTVEKVRAALLDPKFVGDLAALAEHVKQLEVLIGVRRETLAEEQARAKESAAARRAEIVVEAEALATSTNWRRTTERYRLLVDEWKAIPRFDRAGEQDQWKRFSAARSAFDKSRRVHFATTEKEQTSAKEAKKALVAEAESLSGSTDWQATALAYRGLMDRWKKAGFAGKPDDDKLWRAFRAAQDVFFAARKSALDERDQQWADNLAAKRAIIEKAEALLPVSDQKAARAKFRALQSEFGAIGHVPRADKPKLDARLTKVDEAIRKAEQDQWRRTDPEKNDRARALVTLYERQLADLEAKAADARAAGRDTTTLNAEIVSAKGLLEAAKRYA